MLPRSLTCLTLLLALVFAAPAAHAEDPWDLEQPDPAAVKQALERTQTALAAVGDATDEATSAHREALTRRLKLLGELATVVEPRVVPGPADEARRDAETARRREEIDALLRRPVDLDDVRPRTSADLASYDDGLKRAQDVLDGAQRTLSQTRDRRQRLVREVQRELPERLAAAQAERTAPVPVAMAVREPLLRGNARLAERIVLLRLARAKADLDQSDGVPAAQAEVDLARVLLERAQVRYQHAVAAVRRELLIAAGRERREAEAATVAAEADPDPVRRLRRRMRAERDLVNADTRQDAAGEADLDARIKEAQQARDAAAQERERITQRLEGGDPSELAERLLTTRKRVRRQLDALLGQRLPELHREIATTQAERSRLLERLWRLDVPTEENAELAAFLERVRAAAPRREDEARIVFSLAVLGQNGLIPALRTRLATIDGNLKRLEDLRQATQGRVDALRTLGAFVLTRLIWVRSDDMLGPATFEQAVSDIPQVGAVLTGPAVGEPLVGWYERAPLPHGILTLLIVLGFVLLYLTTRAIRAAGGDPTNGEARLPALRALWSATWRSALLPAYLALAVLLLRVLGVPRGVGQVLGEPLLQVAGLWFGARLTWRLFRTDGVAVARFGMGPALAGEFRRAGRWLLWGLIGLAVPATVLSAAPFELAALPRVLHTAFALIAAIALARLIQPSGTLLRTLGRDALFWRRLGRLLAPLAIIALFGIVVMDVLGYRTGARLFLSGALQTSAFVFLLLGLHQVSKRLIRGLAEGVRRRAALASGGAEAREMSASVVSQLSQLALTALVITAVLLLGDLWDLDASVASLFEGIELASLSENTALTAWDLLRALAYIVFAHFVSRNVAAVLDTLASPTAGTHDVGNRYVTVTLLRYAILLFGYGAALLAIHFSFASIGWALAAVSFGIGFGMQEIVANFVSGLILLLERPIRVGDIITVGDTGGVVEQITVRSTVVTNWDRQQIIVPNKRLITENVTNWTRNDLVTRRKVNVGVAYGSDVELVLKILSTAAAGDPGVRKDPPPRVLFQAFGDSSLDFDLWVYTRYDEGVVVRSRLYAEIDQRFREAGITIPFPQRDVHLRQVNEDVAPEPGAP